METGKRINPFMNFNFILEIDGITQASFKECSGLSISTEAVDYREGGDNLGVKKLVGKTTYSEITLKWGMTDSTEMWEWRKSVLDGSIERKNGSIVLLDQTGTEKVRWNFVSAWPSKWEGPSLDATANDVALETLTIVHEGLSRA